MNWNNDPNAGYGRNNNPNPNAGIGAGNPNAGYGGTPLPNTGGNVMSAVATVRGSSAYPNIAGTMRFTQTPQGVVVNADIFGLPITPAGFFGFHLHQGPCGSPQAPNAFAESGDHFNPQNLPHPRHAGDFPVLLETRQGRAQLRFVTDRFLLSQVIGRSVVIHLQPNDYHTQPSGNSGDKIACGLISAATAVQPPPPEPYYPMPSGPING